MDNPSIMTPADLLMTVLCRTRKRIINLLPVPDNAEKIRSGNPIPIPNRIKCRKFEK